jgi:hypothetical protein
MLLIKRFVYVCLRRESRASQGYIVRFGQCSVFLIPINKRQPLEISVVLSRWGRCTVVNSAPIVKRSWNQEKYTLPWPWGKQSQQTATLVIHKNGSGAATRNSCETSNKQKMLRIEPRLAFNNSVLLANRV